MSLPFRLSAFYFAHFVHAGFFVAYFPIYLASRGLRPLEIAWIVALPQIARTFAPAAWGVAAERSAAEREFVIFACAATVLGCAALPFVEGFAALACVVALMSVLSAGGLPLVEAITLGALAEEPGRYGPIRLWGSVGFIGAVAAGGVWLDREPASLLPWALAAFALLALAAALSLPRRAAQTHSEPRGSWHLTPAVRSVLGAGFCMAAAHGTLYAFLTLHLERAGYSTTLAGALWALGVIAEIIVFVYLPQLFRRFTLSAILAASFACAVARFLALGLLVEWLWIVVIAQLLHAGTFGAFHAASLVAVRRVFPPSAHALGQTLFSSVSYGAGGALGALAAGALWDAAGPAAAFAFSALAGLAGLVLAKALKREGL